MSFRRAIVWLLLIAYTFVASGVPVPMPVAKQSFAERFPCENCGCGCATADHCWRSCCCHTPAERLAWAARNGVEPPAFVKALAASAPTSPTTLPACCQARLAKKAAAPENTGIVAWRALSCRGQLMKWLVVVAEPWRTVEPLLLPTPPVVWCPVVPTLVVGRSDQPLAPPPEGIGFAVV